jgi:PPOX class probable F420-dependent enzyme
MHIDMTTPFGERVTRRLRDERAIWMVTTRTDGTPEPSPVWFVWDGETFLMYSLRDTSRQRNLSRNARVSLCFDSNNGHDVVVFTGEAAVDESAPPAHANAAYTVKYRADMGRIGGTLEGFSKKYSLPIRIRPTRLRGH